MNGRRLVTIGHGYSAGFLTRRLVPEGWTVTGTTRDGAAKVAAADAAYLASRRALQVLGAIGYTSEHDLSLYITKTRALVSAWGTPAQHRAFRPRPAPR